MYPVSAAYIAAMNKPIQRHDISGTIGGVHFSSKDILRDSIAISNQCSDQKDLTLGGVYIGVMKFTLVNDLGIERGTWKGKKIVLKFSMLVGQNPDNWETIPAGVYIVAEANHTERGIELTCYDNMSKFDKDYPQTGTNGFLYDIMALACLECGLTFGMTREECAALPNGEVMLGIYADNGCKTWRDVVHYLAQLMGGFATADRNGKIVLRRFGNPTGFTVDTRRRLTGSKFSDFKTNYTGLSAVNMVDKTTRYVHAAIDDGLTLNIGSNPFVQFGAEEIIIAMLLNILAEANRVKYIPFSSAMVGNPAFDLGDIIEYTGGVAGVKSTCCLMSYSWKFNKNYAVQGFGKNPSLATAQSKAEKDINSLSSQTKGDSLMFSTYINSLDFIVGEDFRRIADFKITNTRPTIVDFWIEIKLQVVKNAGSDAAVLKFKYQFDEGFEPYEPVMTYNHDGTYTLGLHYYVNLTTVLQHSFNVWLQVEGGAVVIKRGDMHAVIKGQGLTDAEGWSGLLEFRDTFALPIHGKMRFNFADNLETKIYNPEVFSLLDRFSLPARGKMGIHFEDSVTFLTQTGVFELITEDGRNLMTEAESPYLTNGGTENG